MKIVQQAVYFFILFFPLSSNAMEKKSSIKKLNETCFSHITQKRVIPRLIDLCYQPLALKVLADIKKDADYDFEKFKNVFLKLEGHYKVWQKLCLFLAENVTSLKLKEIDTTVGKNRIDHVCFSGNNFMWSRKNELMPNAQGSFWDCYGLQTCSIGPDQIESSSTVANFYKHNVSDTKKCFALSAHGYFARIENQRLYIMKEKECYFEIHLSNISILDGACFSCVTFNPTTHSCFVGTTKGEIFILNFADNALCEKKKLADIYESTIQALHCSNDQQLYSCDSEGTSHVWLHGFSVPHQIPINKPINAITSSSDNSLVAFQHAENQEDVSILNWNTLTSRTHTLGKVIAFTRSRKILALKEQELIYYNYDGEILNTFEIKHDAIVCGNRMLLMEYAPLYVIAIMADKKKEVDTYSYYASPSGLRIRFRTGSHQETGVESSFSIPDEHTDEELFKGLIASRNYHAIDCD
jgi:hypothetical protein